MVLEGDIKLVARIAALEILVQDLLWQAFDRNLDALRAYAAALHASLAGSSVSGLDPSRSDLLASEIQDAAAEMLDALIERQEAQAGPGDEDRT